MWYLPLCLCALFAAINADAAPKKPVLSEQPEAQRLEREAKAMGMTAEEHANMHKLPKGSGASSDGAAWLVPDAAGAYVLHNCTILGAEANSVELEAGKAYRVMPHKGPCIWTPPGGKQGPVPAANLIPIKKTYP